MSEKETTKTILVTGGAGYLGCQVIKDLSSQFKDYKIIIIDNLSKGKLENVYEVIDSVNANIEVIPSELSDIRDHNIMSEILEAHKPKIIIHLAAIVDAFCTNRPGKDKECMDTNHASAVELAKIAKDKGVKIFIYISTVSIYSQGRDIEETGQQVPLSAYAIAKGKADESILSMNSEDFKTCSLRPATIIGYTPGFRYETIINLCCIRSIYNVPVRIFKSALDNEKSYVYVEDMSQSILFTINNIDKTKGQAFNVSSLNVNLNQVISAIENHLGKPMNKTIVNESKINQQVYTISADKIKKYGFTPKHKDINKIISTTLNQLQYNKSKRKWLSR